MFRENKSFTSKVLRELETENQKIPVSILIDYLYNVKYTFYAYVDETNSIKLVCKQPGK